MCQVLRSTECCDNTLSGGLPSGWSGKACFPREIGFELRPSNSHNTVGMGRERYSRFRKQHIQQVVLKLRGMGVGMLRVWQGEWGPSNYIPVQQHERN